MSAVCLQSSSRRCIHLPQSWHEAGVYFERQSGPYCTLHAMNNAAGVRWMTAQDLRDACKEHIEGKKRIRKWVCPWNHSSLNGWFSRRVISGATRMAGIFSVRSWRHVLENSLGEIHSAVGILVDSGDTHWVAVRAVGTKIWLLDDRESRPVLLSTQAFRLLVVSSRVIVAILQM